MLPSNRAAVLGVWCCLLACALAACASFAPIDASRFDGIPSKRVSYADLDLNSAAGVRVLLHRLKWAAAEVCAPLEGWELRQNRSWHACYAHALADGVRQVNHPMLTVLYHASVRTAMLRQSDAVQ